jgi:chemotaxis protein histidine kinase CheA
VHIQVKDDGAGINARRVREKALDCGLIHPDAALNDKEIFDLIFLPGFSTAAAVTDILGDDTIALVLDTNKIINRCAARAPAYKS